MSEQARREESYGCRLLLAMGIETEAAKSSMRFSLHRELTEDEIDEACRRIAAAVNRLRQ